MYLLKILMMSLMLICLFNSCTMLLMSQRTPSGSSQQSTITTSVDSTSVTLRPSF